MSISKQTKRDNFGSIFSKNIVLSQFDVFGAASVTRTHTPFGTRS